MNAQRPVQPFFLKLILLLILAGGIYRLLQSILHIADIHRWDGILSLYPKDYGTWHPVGIAFAGLGCIIACMYFWKGDRRGWPMYMGAKIILATIEILGFMSWNAAAGKGFPWITTVVYIVVWALFPLIVWSYKSYFLWKKTSM